MTTVYLDVCCLNRPFDDQRQPRIRMEAEAVALVFEQIDAGRCRQVSSQVAEMEIAATADPERRRRVRALLPPPRDRIRLNAALFERGELLVKRGFPAVDALHVAAAEASGAAVMLTCDDRVCAVGRRLRKLLTVRVLNPLEWIQEIGDESNA